MDLGGQIGPVLGSCCDLRQECGRVVWADADSGQCLEGGARLSGEGDVSVGEELLEDGGMGPGTDAGMRRDEEVAPAASSETQDGTLDKGVGVWEMDGGEGDTHAEAADDISASSCQEEEEGEKMEKEQSGAVEEEEVSMETCEVTSPQSEEDTHRC